MSKKRSPKHADTSKARTKSSAKAPVKAKATPHASADEIRRAGDLASDNADRVQSERMDPPVQETAADKRVHEWMKQRHQTLKPDTSATSKTAVKAGPTSKTTAAQHAAENNAPDAKSGTKKATAADFDAAAEKQQKAPELKPGQKPHASVDADQQESPAEEHAAQAVIAAKKNEDVKSATPANAAAEKTNVAAVKNDDDDTEDAQDDDDVAPAVRTAILQRDTRGRIIVPGPMRGSHAILVHQNVMATKDGLDRIEDDDHLDRLRKARLLLPLPSNGTVHADPRLTANRRYARPWVVRFLNDMANAHYAHFHDSLQVNSAVRTIAFQRRLMRTNGNAAPPTGETASPHLTGQAVDIAKHGMSMTEIAWMRGYLLPLVQQGKIDVEEEFQQACFHISIYKAYMPERAPKRRINSRRIGGRAIAAAIP